MMTKRELRREYLERRQALTDTEVQESSLKIANKALELDIWSFSNYHIFLPIQKQKEINTEYLLHILQGKDKNILVSKSNFEDVSMSHYLLTDQTKLKISSYGIPEPDHEGIPVDEKNIDVVFVPLLTADRFGNRVGYGKGFYDRFLKRCRPDVVKVGLSFFKPIESKIDTHVNDIGLNYIIYGEEAIDLG
jgi:5-formyltetrahydrofolate cyclo-ligase